MSATIPAGWARSVTDPQAFAEEQDKLASVWTLLGLTTDVARDGDWFRATLATRSVFVQRFGTELRGFENRCAHRFYPLRLADKGNGPIVCGFHHWRYNRDGVALGIPLCEEVYGVTPRELNARLIPLEIATCGSLVFGRFPAPGATQSLEEFLGDGFPILQAMAQMGSSPQFLTTTIKANWKLCFHISFDDYHGVAVHPTTFGKLGYLHRKNVTYERFGLHSAFLSTTEPDAFKRMVTACRNGTFRSANYRIFQFMPNLLVSHFRSDGQFWYCVIQQYVPVAHDRTVMRAWLYPAPFPSNLTPLARRIRLFTDPVRRHVVRYYTRRVFREDNAVCEQLQTIAHQVRGAPIISAVEERIAWFEQSYAAILAGVESLPNQEPVCVRSADR